MFHILPLAVLKEEHSYISLKTQITSYVFAACKYSREDNRAGIGFGITKFSFC